MSKASKETLKPQPLTSSGSNQPKSIRPMELKKRVNFNINNSGDESSKTEPPPVPRNDSVDSQT